jgi:hypothetical protein
MEESIQAIKEDLQILEKDIVNQLDGMEGEIEEMKELFEELAIPEKRKKFIKPKEFFSEMKF